jgi:hypothetical protein
MRRRRARIAPAAWLVLLLAVPAISLALGARQPLMDNRPKTPWPSVGAADLLRHKTYTTFDAALLERLPTRKPAVRAHAEISVRLFGESTNPDVAVGRDGWLYYTWALATCGALAPAHDPAEAAEITARTIIASGRRALIVEPADKLQIHPRRAPDFPRDQMRCANALQRAVARRLATTPGGVDLDATMRRIETAGHLAFLPHDSHWSHHGRIAFARLVLDFIDPGLSRRAGLTLGPWYDRHSDLYAQLGLPATDRDREVALARPVPEAVPSGPTLILGDSQMIETFVAPGARGGPAMIDQLPLGTTVCHLWDQLIKGACDDAVRGAAAIAIESAGRNLVFFEAACARIVSLVTESMRGPAGRYAVLGGAAERPDGQVVVGPGKTVDLQVVPARGDVRPTARLLRIPIRALPPNGSVTMVERPVKGAATPCSTPGPAAAGTTLTVPLPAGRPASTMAARVTAPPGTVLGRPEEIQLGREAG